MSIVAVMEGIEAALSTIPGLRTSPIKPDQVNPPQAVVGVPDVTDYIEALSRRKVALAPTITILTSMALDQVGQKLLASYTEADGPSSVVAALDFDRTLGGAVEDIQVVSFRKLGMQEVGQIGYYGGLFTTRCMIAIGD